MWVGAVELKPVGRKAADGGLARVELEARKAVAPGIGPRLFQDRTPRLPCDTPGALRDLRERELSILKVHETNKLFIQAFSLQNFFLKRRVSMCIF